MTEPELLKSLLAGSEKSVCTAESCTGGNIAHHITSVSGSSEYFIGSVVSYSAKVKIKILGVEQNTINTFGIVSSNVAAEMAKGVRKLLKTDYSVSITGWADAYGDDFEPAGTAWVGIDSANGTSTYRLESHKSRIENIEYFSRKALELLCGAVSE